MHCVWCGSGVITRVYLERVEVWTCDYNGVGGVCVCNQVVK